MIPHFARKNALWGSYFKSHPLHFNDMSNLISIRFWHLIPLLMQYPQRNPQNTSNSQKSTVTKNLSIMAKSVNLQHISTKFTDITLIFCFENFPDHFPFLQIWNPQVNILYGSAQILLIINLKRVWSVARSHRGCAVPITEKVWFLANLGKKSFQKWRMQKIGIRKTGEIRHSRYKIRFHSDCT